MRAAAEGEASVDVREFECLGACDIAPMASVDGTYVGPLEPADAERILDDLRAGRPVLEEKQLLRRPVADPGANSR
jgi:(2Fe-2S) ferredoxin